MVIFWVKTNKTKKTPSQHSLTTITRENYTSRTYFSQMSLWSPSTAPRCGLESAQDDEFPLRLLVHSETGDQETSHTYSRFNMSRPLVWRTEILTARKGQARSSSLWSPSTAPRCGLESAQDDEFPLRLLVHSETGDQETSHTYSRFNMSRPLVWRTEILTARKGQARSSSVSSSRPPQLGKFVVAANLFE